MSLENEIKELREAVIELTKAMQMQEKPKHIAPATPEPKAKETKKPAPKAKETKQPEPKAEPKPEITHAGVQETCVQLSRAGVPASDIKALVKSYGVDKVAGVANADLPELAKELGMLAVKYKVEL